MVTVTFGRSPSAEGIEDASSEARSICHLSPQLYISRYKQCRDTMIGSDVCKRRQPVRIGQEPSAKGEDAFPTARNEAAAPHTGREVLRRQLMQGRSVRVGGRRVGKGELLVLPDQDSPHDPGAHAAQKTESRHSAHGDRVTGAIGIDEEATNEYRTS